MTLLTKPEPCEPNGRARHERSLPLILAYALAYAVASLLDLWTTHWVLITGGSEKNVFMLSEHGYVLHRSLIITLLGGLIMIAAFAFGVRRADQVSDRWLHRPLASFGLLYLNPWSVRARDRAPLHMLAQAMAFVALRLLAALNNLAIALGGVGPIGWLVQQAGVVTSPMLGFVLVIFPLFAAITLCMAPGSAALIRRLGD